ncbi:SGNH/GDSL hydrolase family protein [Spirosoma oryzicola]|uniref:SGNH/GDSL hydrolase family protein n=1 Tax=Spirosoma oryzicola TaxID=2898794 RepID=UPI001E64B882|nr:hypothetical protein [Spirosoma oryzicola]UHG93234.1 hypothetical protein LQ777_10115 [Spirosoma oryzicola]
MRNVFVMVLALWSGVAMAQLGSGVSKAVYANDKLVQAGMDSLQSAQISANTTKLTPLQSLTTVVVFPKNIFDAGAVLKDVFINNADGSFVTSGATGWTVTGALPVSFGTYTISGLPSTTSKAVRFENAVGSVVGVWNIATQGTTFTVPVGSTVAYITLSRADEVLNLSGVQIEQGSVATAYSAYFPPFSRTTLNANTIPVISPRAVTSKNLFTGQNTRDGYFLENTGLETANSTYSYTDFIAVKPGLTYTGWDGVNGMRKTTFYDASKNVVSGGSTNLITSFTVPSGVAYARVSYFSARKASFQFEQSASATTFQAYFTPITTGFYANETYIPFPSSQETKVTLKDVERLTFFGDSYTDGVDQLKGKSYMSILSLFSDWNFENYSLAGNTFASILTRIQNNDKTFHSSVGIKDFSGGGYAMILSWTNEFAANPINATNQLTIYLSSLKSLCDAVKALGYKPIIANEYYTGNGTYGNLVQSALSEFAQREGYVYVDVAQKAQLIRGTPDNPKYWYGSHPGTRTNTVFWSPMMRHIHALPRPRQAIKIFPKRTSYTQSGINDFLYTDYSNRAKMFKEIFLSQHPMGSSVEKYYDDLTTLNGLGTYTGQTVNDYLKLMNSETVSIADYALVECVVNATAGNVTTFGLGLSDVGATVYVRDYVSNAWVQLTKTAQADGSAVYYITNTKNQISYDKATFLIYKSGGYALQNPYYKWSGTVGKDMNQRSLPVDLASSELLTTPTFSNSSLTGWTVTGTVTGTTPDNTPAGANLIATVDQTNFVSQTVNFAAESERTRKIQIKVIARRNPAAFSSSNAYPSASAITDDTYDLASLGIDLTLNSNNILYFSRNVGLHWTEALVEFQLPPNMSSVTVTLKSRDLQIELAKASVKIEP